MDKERALRLYLVPIFVATAWWSLRRAVYSREWDEGPLIFLFVVASIGLVLATSRLAQWLGPRPGPEAGVGAGRRLAGALLVASALLLAPDVAILRDYLRLESAPLVDIGGNTWAAAVHFADRGENPYTHRSQLNPVSGDPHVTTTTDGRTAMWGVPYFYGYPYFPAMFLSYVPFRWIDPGPHSIRLGNALLLALSIGGVGWLAYRLAPRARATFAFSFAVFLLLLTEGIGRQLFSRGITDLLPGVYLLFCFIALSYDQRFLAGALLGTAFACKLIPGLVAAPALLAWSARRGELSRTALGFVAAVTALMLPFVLWHPPAFLSATMLFYLTHHAHGDGTSLWYYLPEFLQAPFLGLGGLLVLLGVTASWWRARTDHRGLARITVVACFTFLAFNKMIHTNYQFAILPLACAVLAADAVQPGGARKPEAGSPTGERERQ